MARPGGRVQYVIEPGQRFGKGVVIDPEVRLPPTKAVPSGKRAARLRCDCGTEYVAAIGNLIHRNTKSCGCLCARHPDRRKHPLRPAWHAMKYRCENPDHSSYSRYGGRGIKVCERWQDFSVFVADIEREIGPRPLGKTLDRVNNDGDYEPGNVRWANSILQNRNKRRTSKLSPEDVADCLVRWSAGESISDLACEYDVHNSTMNRRLHAALDLDLRFLEWWEAWSAGNLEVSPRTAARAAWEQARKERLNL